MCEFLDKIENEGIEKGIEQGIEKGRATGHAEGQQQKEEEIILNMLENNVSDEQIILYTGASEQKIKEMKEKLVCVK